MRNFPNFAMATFVTYSMSLILSDSLCRKHANHYSEERCHQLTTDCVYQTVI